MSKNILLCFWLCCAHIPGLFAQTVIISDDSTYTAGQASAVLDLKSTSRGFLGPRVTYLQKSAINTPATGLLVFQTDSISGYYLWTGTRWEILETGLGGVDMVAKTASDTLEKTETYILVSNNITVTLPNISPNDDGLTITIKNIGLPTDLVLVKALGTATIDGLTEAYNLTRWQAKSFIAYQGNWQLKQKDLGSRNNILEISSTSSWTSLAEAIDYLNLHMNSPSTIRLSAGSYPISNTLSINLPYPLTITGISYGSVSLTAASGLAGNPMFTINSETYFRMLKFDAGTLSGYGNASNEDAIVLNGSAKKYCDLNECRLEGFNKAIVLKNNSELWVFNCYLLNMKASAIEISADTAKGIVFRVAETKFYNCPVGVNLVSSDSATIVISNSGFYSSNGTDVVVNYIPSTFLAFNALTVMNNYWNGTGKFLSGFDFTRTDGRDANIYIQSNVNEPDHNASVMINVTNNSLPTTMLNANTWYKLNWVNTNTIITNWKVENNKITFLPNNLRDARLFITGNVIDNAAKKATITIGLVKNGNTSVIYGATVIYVPMIGDPYQFATVITLQNISKNDYFELYSKTDNSLDSISITDLQWLTETK